MEPGGFQLTGHGKSSPVAPQPGAGGRLHHSQSHGSYKQLHESPQEGWLDPTQLPLEPPGGSAEAGVQPWFSRSQSQGSLSVSSSTQGGGSGFMLATNLSSIPQQPHSGSSTPLPHIPSFSVSPSNSSVSQPHAGSSSSSESAAPLLWGEVKAGGDEKGEEGSGGGGGAVAGKHPVRSLWQDGWRAEGLVCSVPRLHQHPSPPLTQEELSSVQSCLDHPRNASGHNPVLHSIDLQYHIRDAEHCKKMSGANFTPSELPSLPEKFWSSKVKKALHDPLEAPPIPHPLPNLDPSSVALLLRKSTATICCHSGYHSTSLRALDTLAGVMGDFLCRLSKQMSMHSNQQQESGSSGFQGPLERTLWECGVQGRAELHEFWRSEVKSRTQRLQERAMQLHEEPAPPSSQSPPLPRPLSLSLAPWPPEPEVGEEAEDEISLEEALNANMDIVAPTTTPHPGAMFMPEVPSQEPEGFVLLTPDIPSRKRLRTSSSFSE